MIKYNGLAEFVLKGINNGVNIEDLYFKAINNYGYSKPYRSFSKYVSEIKWRNFRQNNKNQKEKSTEELFLNELRKENFINIEEMSKRIKCTKTYLVDLISEFRRSGYEIVFFDGKVMLSNDEVVNTNNINNPLESNEIIFGVASDLHFGSKACQITALNRFCEICKKEGVKYIFSPGDIVAGYNVYSGQLFDLYSISADEQEQSVIKNLPHGFEWIMIGGNHDYSFIKKGGGHNPLSVIESNRQDVTYVGFDEVTVPILNNVDLMMWHPSGGVPYSISYRLQKGIEQLSFDELRDVCNGKKEKPTLRFVLAGHLHIQLQAMFGSIFGMQCGTFEGTTNYLKRKGLSPSIGGWIVKAELGINGLLRNFSSKFYLFDEIENDWRNYSHELKNEEKIKKPLFKESK